MKAIFYITRAAVIVLAFTSQHVKAELLLEQYNQHKDSKVYLDYIHGVGKGIIWSHSMTQAYRKHAPLFCVPENLSFNAYFIRSLIEQEISTPATISPYKGTTPVELILLNSLIARFPCGQ